ncbi:hypothetical protein BX600DRAFT_387845 [Xylariales sp. PMI_506]|nr:hypothetical protein BX600DRAFT_387845 [Xylariales sp. PMI_506]
MSAAPGSAGTGTGSPAQPAPAIRLEKELSDLLEVQTVSIPAGPQTSSTRLMLKTSNEVNRPYLPGQPRIQLDNSSANATELLEYLRKSHLTKELDSLLPFMKYIFVQTPSYRHIMPLHHQKAHAREVIVNEQPGLHLVWHYETIFIKPIPAYMYSQAFWDYIVLADPDVYQAAVGFLRSYYFIIQYEIDFDEACAKRLVPKKPDGTHPTYEEFCAFIEPFRRIADDGVSRRFHYGELRLTRINRTAMLFKLSLAYFHIYPQWGSFLAQQLAPVITVFAVCSVVLNSMQVTLSAQQISPSAVTGDGWIAFTDISLYFPIVVICLIAAVLGVGLLGIILMGLKDLFSAKAVRDKKRRHKDQEIGEKTHGMIW